ncbi:MAG: DAK2 domain-containing protein [Ardenticatenaceae bacterium]|nr:DAK2 domain-containing protein [Anaerolineales bacterium]MCB9008696.1 DAK2 domain-containing protein [Ardenticatenaceae bacterium]
MTQTHTTEATQMAAPPPPKWLHCNGQQLKKLAFAALNWLDQNHQHVNALNVFPVPDGDTGTNMLLTMRSAYGRVQNSEEEHVGKIAEQLAHGALMGARGNSGVILSQIWRGLAKGLKGKETFNAQELADAFQAASETAYGGVMKPVEGTILTIIREGASEAADAAKKSRDLRFLLERVLERCNQALERTPEQLAILKQAGVVDSGGQGLVYIFEGMLRYVYGKMNELKLSAVPSSNNVGFQQQITAQELAMPDGGEIENPYDVQFILMGQNLNVTEVRSRIDAMGDSTVVVGDESTIKVHIHVKDPGVPISYGISLGKITDVVVENMQMQMEEIVHLPATPVATAVPLIKPTVQPGQIGVVAVAAGDGLAEIFRSMGVSYVVNGGQTNNPSIEELFQAIQDVPTDKVIILPNNKNIILAAEAARDLSPKHVAVVPTKTAPQGLSALLSLNPDGTLEETAAAMCDAAQDVSTGEITRATRTVTLDGVEVNEGEFIGLVDGRLCTSGSELTAVLTAVLTAMEMEERELLSLYYGQDITEDEAQELAGQIEEQYEEIEIELLAGGQPYYFYILGAE